MLTILKTIEHEGQTWHELRYADDDYQKDTIIVDGENEFDVRYEMDLRIPDYGEVDGDIWRQNWIRYVKEKAEILRNTNET